MLNLVLKPIRETRKELVQTLRHGDVESALKKLSGLNALGRTYTLEYIIGSQTARAPTRKDQYQFFERASAVVKLRQTQQVMLLVAMTYTAIEANLRGKYLGLEKNLVLWRERSISWRGNRILSKVGKKQGTHLYFSIQTVLCHLHLVQGKKSAFLQDAQRLRHRLSTDAKIIRDTGFGWAITNCICTMAIEATCSVKDRNLGNAEAIKKTMMRILQVGISGRAGPIEWPSFYHSCIRTERVKKLIAEPNDAFFEETLNSVIRVRSEYQKLRIKETLFGELHEDES